MKELSGRELEAALIRSAQKTDAIRVQAEREIREDRFNAHVQKEKARLLRQRRPWWKKLSQIRVSITITGE